MSMSSVGAAVVEDSHAIASWMSKELVEKTRAVWSKVYGRSVSEFEAVQILRNVKRLAELVYRSHDLPPVAMAMVA